MRITPSRILVFTLALSGVARASAAPPNTNRAKPVTNQNPLLQPWSGPYGGVPPWDQVKPDLFKPAFDAAIAEQRAEIERIAASRGAPTFDNTILAMERAGRTLDRLDRLFSVITSNVTTPELQAIDKEVAPKQAAADDEITFNEALFRRIDAVYAARDKLPPEQKRLTERVHDRFVRSGAKLDQAQKTRLAAINQELAVAFTDFAAKVLADENTWVVLDKEADLAGLPAAMVSSYRAAAEERKLPGKWVIVNTRSSVDPFLTFSTRRDLREKVWRAFTQRGDNGNDHDTKATIARIVKLRAERAKLLGFASHAHWRMDDTMAKDPKAAQALMLRVWPAAVARVREEVADMQAIADKEGAKIKIEPWDYRFYAEKVRKARYAIDQSEVKPYFALENLIQGGFWCAEQLYGLQFMEITGKVPTFHPDVRVWEVKDKTSGKHVGLFYGDYFARAGKRSGAWAAGYRSQRRLDGPVTAITSNNNNFVKAAAGEPVLISLDDARTLFHEFGHAIHGLLQDVEYPGLAGTPRDFVEFPSQVNEHWVLTREVLNKFARHYKTGEPMPQALVDKINKSRTFNQGFATVEYLASAIVDMELHTLPGGDVDAAKFERETLARIGMPREIAMRHRLPHFNHLFTSDAYSAGYYSYLWSEVMDADAWGAFEEAGNPFDKGTAEKMRRYILSNGNSIDRAEAYRLFRGRDPDVKALLEKRGFPTSAP
ncbi:MAG TPA: M3 family metallopeptidase [Polyangia bacterium]|nr:M3 family metallopeptidase [Polyangia bacterium]